MNSITQAFGVILDFFTLYTPYKDDGSYKFAFIVHPRARFDIERKFPFLKYLPNFVINLLTKYFWPVTVSKVTGLKSIKTGKNIDGYIISILPPAHQLMENRELALKRIVQACILAKKKGAKIIGLGGLTSSLSKGGLDLLNKKVDINITTGHAYTSFNVTQNIFKLAEILELVPDRLCIGIVGAAGSIGSTSAKILAKNNYNNFLLVDLERKRDNCKNLQAEINSINPLATVEITHRIGDIKKCDIIIAATNAPEALIKASDLKWGAIIVDDAQPSDVHQDVFERKDVLVVEAGVTHTPHIHNNFNFGLKSRFDNFCCLAEVLILAANEWGKHYVINRATLEHVDEIAEKGKNLNFSIGNFQNFHETISQEKIAYVKQCISTKK